MTRVQKQLSLDTEAYYWSLGREVIGVDEVGRGCLAGPVVVAAVSFKPTHKPHFKVRDSKKLSQKWREELCEFILEEAETVGIGLMTVDIIDEHNILEATKLAMVQAVSFFPDSAHVIVDGNEEPEGLGNYTLETIIKGDDNCYSIAAASIVAKVIRDQLMVELHQQYPQYDWENNKGYGTKKHREALLEFGPTKTHRAKFIRKILKFS